MSDNLFDIAIVGLGIMGVRHLTREGEDYLRASNTVYMVDSGFGVADHIRTLSGDVVDLLEEYEEGVYRLNTYKAMAARVIAGAMDRPPVSFAVYGHPSFLVYPSSLIRMAGSLLDLKVVIAPGISSLDTLLVDIGLDPGQSGLHLYDATSVLVEQRPLDPEVPCVLFQVTTVESGIFSMARSSPARFARLEQYLLRYYPRSHLAALVESATFPAFPSRIRWLPIAGIGKAIVEEGLGGTLFIPPLEQRTVRDPELLRMLADPEHLKEITQ